LGDAGWQRATRCEDWTVADVILHLAQTDELALASVHGAFAEGLDVLAGRPGTTTQCGRWRGGDGGTRARARRGCAVRAVADRRRRFA
jgi:hypothetical protein